MAVNIHNVKVYVNGDLLVEATPNPVTIDGGDAVVWQVSLDPCLADRQVGIRFGRFTPRGRSSTPVNHPVFGPFEAVSLAGNVFTAAGDSGRRGEFVYDVFLVEQGVAGAELRWLNGGNGGGLDNGGPE